MDTVITAVKADLTNIINAGQYMLLSLFILAVVVNYIGILTHQVNWADVILRLVIGVILLQNYVWVMDTTRTIITSVDQMVNPNQDFVSQYAQMSNNFWQQQQAATQPSIISQIKIYFSSAIFHNFIINVSFILYAIIANIMEAVRYCLAAIMYKLGPVLISLILFKTTDKVVKGWFTSYVAILSWPILWHIALGIAVDVSNTNSSIEQFACINFSVCFVLIFTPLIINSLIAGIGTGSSSAVAGIMSSNTALGVLATAGHTGVSTAASKFVSPLLHKFFPSNQTPTTTDNNFKKFMLGDDDTNDKGKKP